MQLQKDRAPAPNSEEDDEFETHEKDIKVVALQVVGGRDTGNTDDPNWLLKMEVGTIFLIKDKGNVKEFNLGQFQLIEKFEKSVLLVSSLNGVIKTFVDPVWFCSKYQLWEILALATQQEQEETEEADDNRIQGHTHGTEG